MMVHNRLGPVIPGWGAGPTRLGMVRDEIRAILGDPEFEIDQDEDGDAHLTYPGGVHLYFDPNQSGRLTLILLEAVDALVLSPAIGSQIDEDMLIRWVGVSDHRVREVEFTSEGGARGIERSHDFRDRGITFYIDESRHLTACGVYVVIDEHDRFCWPSPQATEYTT